MVVKDEFTECETDVQLHGKVALVTGATSGIGLEVAKNLARRGAKVIIASRNPSKLANAKESIIQSSGNQNVVARQMDYESLASIRNFVSTTVQTEPRLDILINNIGAVGLEEKITADNLHVMMQVNYFGTFLLTYLLFPLLKASAPSRIVNVASLSSILGQIELDHWNDAGRYPQFGYYCNAKLANVLFTIEMDKKIKGSGVSVYSMDPGLVKSELFRNVETSLLGILSSLFGRPPHRVATMPVFLAIYPRVSSDSGIHFRDCKVFYSSRLANNTILSRRVWEESKKLVKITPQEDWDSGSVLS